MPNNYYIIGAGVAGISAAESLRQGDRSCNITVINGEDYNFYRRLSLSTYLQGQTTLESLLVKKPEEYAELEIMVMQDRVVELKPTANILVMASGATYSYDGLIIATGGGAIRPAIAGLDLKGVRLGYWDIKDTLWYEQQAQNAKGKNAVVIGGGVLGLELADSFNKAGLNVTIVQLGAYLGEPLTDPSAGKIISDRIHASGASCRLDVSAQEIIGDADGQVRAVVTSTGEEIPASVVGVCIGIRPNVSWLKESGVNLEQGCIVVDEFLQTNFHNIYAAGDCTLIKSAIKSGNRVGDRPNRTWQVATSQGIGAATNLLGAKSAYQEGLFYNAGVIYDLPYTLLGKFNPDPNDSEYQTYTYNTGDDPFAYFKLTVSAGRLVGAMLIGRQRRTNILRKIIEGNFLIRGHEQELMDAKFKPTGLPIADISVAGDADVEAKLAAYSSSQV